MKELKYKIVEIPEKKQNGILIESGKFKDFLFIYTHMKLRHEDGASVVSEGEADSENVWLDFQYGLESCPEEYKPADGDEVEFEEHIKNIIIDILVNHPEAYGLKDS